MPPFDLALSRALPIGVNEAAAPFSLLATRALPIGEAASSATLLMTRAMPIGAVNAIVAEPQYWYRVNASWRPIYVQRRINGTLNVSNSSPPSAAMVVSVSGNRIRVDSTPVRLWGVRAASATQTESLKNKLITALATWSTTPMNCVTVFYQGSSGGNSRAFSTDGTSFEPGVESRMQAIAEECRSRGIVLIVGLFYQTATELGPSTASAVVRDAAYRNATRLVATSLLPYRNIIINIANENTSSGWPTNTTLAPAFANAENVMRACAWVKEIDPARIVGGGGFGISDNVEIGLDPRADVVLYDTIDTATMATRHDPLISAGVTKPSINVETFGGSTRDIDPTPGVYNATWSNGVTSGGLFKAEVDEVLARSSVNNYSSGSLMHDNRWFQMFSLGGARTLDDNRFDFGDEGYQSNGTSTSKGWGWWARYIAATQ